MCYIERQIAEHCNEDNIDCPMCHEQSLEEHNNMYGTWYECQNCNYETEQQ